MSQGAGATLSHEEYLQQNYLPSLDGVRAISVLLVISTHMFDGPTMWHWLGGARGVTIFFILSGYLITTLGLREERRFGRVSLTAFYVRRSFRIFPLYYLTLAAYVVIILGFGIGSQGPLLRKALPYYLFYMPEVPFYRWAVRGGLDLAFVQSWTLGVEEKFYLVWPFLAFTLCRSQKSARLVVAVGLSTAFLLLASGLAFGDRQLQIIGRNFFTYYPILIGCILAILLDDEAWYRRMRGLATPAGTLLLCVSFLAVHFASPWVPNLLLWNVWGALYSLVTVLLLTSLVVGRGPLQSFLARPTLAVVGQHSYGMYLIHFFAISLAHRLVSSGLALPVRGSLRYVFACAISLLAAMVLARVVERPCIALGRQLAQRLRAHSKVSALESPGEVVLQTTIVVDSPPVRRISSAELARPKHVA